VFNSAEGLDIHQYRQEAVMENGSRRVAIVTGASGAIGRAICAGMAEQGFRVVMVGRHAGRLELASSSLAKQIPDADIARHIVDVSRKPEVFAFAEKWRGRLDVLINNAAIAPRQRMLTPEGLEMEFATNVMGYVWMMRAFESALRASAPARVVNVASYWAGDLALGDLQFERRRYDNNTAYRQSKQANRMLTVAFAERWGASGITVNCCHPGDANSTLSNALGFGGHETPSEAAETPVWLATDASVAGITGRYFASMQMRACEFAGNREAIAKLDEICASL
jgi:NAD(P)-dependent dehydrogenase (short-subunit alcohol dehydrogenase family)